MDKTIKVLKKVVVYAIFIFVIVIIKSLLDYVSGVSANELAMNQMSSSVDSSMWIQTYMAIRNYGSIIGLVIFILFFRKDIVKLVEWIKTKITGDVKETENEEK